MKRLIYSQNHTKSNQKEPNYLAFNTKSDRQNYENLSEILCEVIYVI